MYLMMTFMIMILTMMFFLIMLNFFFMKMMYKNMEKFSPFECGFDPMNKTRLPFSLQFYLISMIFLIFDMEISMLLPLIKCIKIINMMLFMNLMLIITMILIIGLFSEWKEGTFKWFK